MMTRSQTTGNRPVLTSGMDLPDLQTGLNALWNPWMILLIESVWVAAFFHTGRSVVTGAEISFHVNESKI